MKYIKHLILEITKIIYLSQTKRNEVRILIVLISISIASMIISIPAYIFIELSLSSSNDISNNSLFLLLFITTIMIMLLIMIINSGSKEKTISEILLTFWYLRNISKRYRMKILQKLLIFSVSVVLFTTMFEIANLLSNAINPNSLLLASIFLLLIFLSIYTVLSETSIDQILYHKIKFYANSLMTGIILIFTLSSKEYHSELTKLLSEEWLISYIVFSIGLILSVSASINEYKNWYLALYKKHREDVIHYFNEINLNSTIDNLELRVSNGKKLINSFNGKRKTLDVRSKRNFIIQIILLLLLYIIIVALLHLDWGLKGILYKAALNIGLNRYVF